jgi:hypothetical protein
MTVNVYVLTIKPEPDQETVIRTNGGIGTMDTESTVSGVMRIRIRTAIDNVTSAKRSGIYSMIVPNKEIQLLVGIGGSRVIDRAR